ncbi:MAG: HlyD family secretion protein [Acidobacteriota bacterium]
MNGRTKLIIIAAALAVLVGIGAWWHYSGRESTDEAQIDGHIHQVASRAAGTVIEVEVRENQPVNAGQVLVRIEPRDYEVALARARADLADAQAIAEAARVGVPIASATTSGQFSSARAKVGNAEAGVNASAREVDAAKANLASAQARLKQAKVEAERAARDRDRLKPLFEKDEVSRQQYDAAVTAADAYAAAVESATAAVNQAEQNVALAQARQQQSEGGLASARADLQGAATAPQQVSATRARASSAEARVQMAEAAVKQAELMLGYTTVKAPVDGVIGRKSVEVGQVVQVGQPLFAVVSLGDVWVTANFKETQLAGMRPKQPATVEVDAYGRDFRAHVDSVGAATGARFSLLPSENATGNYVKVVQRLPVKIVFEPGQDPDHLLRPGMSVTATVKVR